MEVPQIVGGFSHFENAIYYRYRQTMKDFVDFF